MHNIFANADTILSYTHLIEMTLLALNVHRVEEKVKSVKCVMPSTSTPKQLQLLKQNRLSQDDAHCTRHFVMQWLLYSCLPLLMTFTHSFRAAMPAAAYFGVVKPSLDHVSLLVQLRVLAGIEVLASAVTCSSSKRKSCEATTTEPILVFMCGTG